MNHHHDPDIERALRDLTTWRGETPHLWRRALENPRAARHRHVLHQVLQWPTCRLVAAVFVMLLIGATVGLVLIPQFGSGIQGMETANSTSAPRLEPSDHLATYLARTDGAGGGGGGYGGSGGVVAGGSVFMTDSVDAPPLQNRDASAPEGGDERAIVRKTNLEISCPDVRGAFLKAQRVASEALGEFVQESSLAGAGRESHATLTLRVKADRLSAVLNELRALGTVQSETQTGEDVTAHTVDLEARLRNEQRVERELLSLLDKRPDAPLKDVLEVHANLGRVRHTIEQMMTQRERLGRLVALASVLVIIRADAQKPAEPVKDEGIGEHFSKVLSASWDRGLRFLSSSIAGCVQVLVGGVLWWLLAVLLLLWSWPHVKRRLSAV